MISLSLPLPLPLSIFVRVRGKPQGFSAESSLKGFIPPPRWSRIVIWTLFTHKCCPGNIVYFYYRLGGEERQINMQSLSAHIAFYELMPLQECFEEKTYMGFFLFFQDPPGQTRGAPVSCPPSLSVTRDHMTRTRAETGHLSVKLLPSLLRLKR